ncbi:putative rlpA-like protein, double-psi beta-barrel [Helianthus annuus]|nr:putative rlpA-like protein, double-psi beta-barrel [Helianthus annuus]KAJ0636891.1 putative rlpA-like protein, double-psi beta-barrel [Helianthus annuus]KAJ0813948.1 putative expansin/Lol pI, expansin, cellulose-binding-like domain superfamily [Helianthus annuus]
MGLFNLCFLWLLLISVSSTNACDRCLHQSKAAFFSTPSSLSSGACGYDSSASSLYGSHLAAAVGSIYKSGSGCGACFQVRCKDSKVCSKAGTQVIVTDLNKNNDTDFVMTPRAFMAMANKGMAHSLLKLGVADVEYKRVPCDYKGNNLTVRVEESTKKPNYLALKFLYQGGQTEIVGVDVAQVGSSSWTYMTRNYGAVWDTSRAPAGPLQLRLVVTSGYDGKWIWAKSVMPVDWTIGGVYDCGVQINDIAQEGCGECDDQNWKS